MNAQVLESVGNITYKDVPKPMLSFGDVLVEVKAVGICGSDIPRIYTNGAHSMPLIPGHEFAGQVVCAPGVGARWMGKRVGVFPLIPCHKCPQCLEKKYEMCNHYDYLGSRSDGAYAEFVKVPRWNLIELPDNVSFEVAAMLEPMAVALHAIRQTGLDIHFSPENQPAAAQQENLSANSENTISLGSSNDFVSLQNVDEQNIKNDKIADITVNSAKESNFTEIDHPKALVIGLGTIGLFVCMHLSAMGIDVYAIGNKDYQKNQAISIGLPQDHIRIGKDIESNTAWLYERTDGANADVVFECVGRQETLVEAIEAAKPAGTVVTVGNPFSDMTLPRDTYWKILRSQLTLSGTWNSSFTHEDSDDWNTVIRMLSEGLIHPENLISHRFPLEDLTKGLEIMRDKTEPYTKVMITM